jgi:hypothetical protein
MVITGPRLPRKLHTQIILPTHNRRHHSPSLPTLRIPLRLLTGQSVPQAIQLPDFRILHYHRALPRVVGYIDILR